MPLVALAFVFAAALVHTAWNLALRNAADRMLFAALALSSGALLGLPVLWLRPALDAPAWGLAVLSAALEVAYFAALARSYRLADFSLAYPVARGAAPPLLALWAWIALGERPSALGALGLGVIVAGLVLLGLTSRGAGRAGFAALGAALLVALLISAYSLVDGVAARRADPWAYTVAVLALTSLGLLLVVLPSRARGAATQLLRVQGLRLVLTGVGMVGAYALVVAAFALAPLAYIGAARECSVVLAALAGWLWLGEGFGVRRVVAALLVAAGIVLLAAGCRTPPALRAEELALLTEGRRWSEAVERGGATVEIDCVRSGGDRRTLDGVEGVEFAFVYGTPAGFEHPTCKSIWARAPDGPRLAFLDAWLWKLAFDPPLALVPRELAVGARWSWTGRAELDGRTLGSAQLTVAAEEELPARVGTRRAVRTVRIDAQHTDGTRISWWFAAGAGLVRVEVLEPGGARASLVTDALRP